MLKWVLSFIISITVVALHGQGLPFVKAHTFSTGIYNDAGTKEVGFERLSKRLFSTNVSQGQIEVYDYTDIFKPFLVKTIDVNTVIAKIRSLDATDNLAVVVGDGNSPQLPGKILFYNEKGNFLRQFSVGSTPKNVIFDNFGNAVVVSNEGQPDSSYSTDPIGTLSLLNIAPGLSNLSQADVRTVGFSLLDTVPYDPLINVYGNDGAQPPSRDLEPEVAAVNENSTKAYVVLQENNALAIIDIASSSIDTVVGLGYQDHNSIGLDASDVAQQINIDTYSRLYGMHQPGDITDFEHNGTQYFLTANTGAAREYSGYNEVVRAKNQPLDPGDFTNQITRLNDTVMGRLNITRSIGDMDGDMLHDSIFSFGSRSFSIWDENGQEVWNSGDQIEQTLEMLHAANFNSDWDDNSSYKSRSDDRGPEPAAVAIGEVDSVRYAFIALKRMGGIMIYDISDPTNPQFEMYELNRDFSKPANDPDAGDLGPSCLEFVPANHTTLGIALLFVANEVSGTISVYQAGMGIGLEEGYEIEEPSFYPNPSQGVFYTQQYGDYEVYNAAGQMVQSVKNQNKVDLSGEPSGYYLIRDVEGGSFRVIKK